MFSETLSGIKSSSYLIPQKKKETQTIFSLVEFGVLKVRLSSCCEASISRALVAGTLSSTFKL